MELNERVWRRELHPLIKAAKRSPSWEELQGHLKLQGITLEQLLIQQVEQYVAKRRAQEAGPGASYEYGRN